MNDTIKRVDKIHFDETEDPLKLLNAISGKTGEMQSYSKNHSITTSASTVTQFVAMSVLLEGKTGTWY